MPTINPYINFNGNAEEAFTFYKSVFALPIGKNLLIANDVPEFMGRVNENENRSKIAISAESKEEAERLFKGLSAGGEVEMPISDSPWASYFGMFRDKYGIEWTVEFKG